MKKLIILFIILGISSVLISQTFKDGEECTLEMKNFVVNPGISYSFDVYITRNSTSWSSLGHLVFVTEIYYSDLVFNYNGTALTNPIVTNLSPIATSTIIDNTIPNMLSVNLVDGGSQVPMVETLLMTVNFDTILPDATSELSWRFGDTTIIDENSDNYNYVNGTLALLGSDNSSLPISPIVYSDDLKILNISPNPFGSSSPVTHLSIIAPEQGLLELNVFNIKGQLVRTLYRNTILKNQEITLTWDGKDSQHNDLSSGVYLYRLLIDSKSYELEKVVIIR